MPLGEAFLSISMHNKTVKNTASMAHPDSAETAVATWDVHLKSRASHGVLLHLVPRSVGTAHAIASLAGLLCRAKRRSDSPFTSPRPTTILFSGSLEKHHLFSQVLYAFSHLDDEEALTIKHVHVDPSLNWFHGEPRARLEGLVRSSNMPTALVLPVTADALGTVSLEDIARLRNLAQVHGKLIVLVTHAMSIEEFGPVASIVDDVILSEPCEPDPGFDFAWTIEFSAAKEFHPDGRGKLMVQIAPKGKGYRLAYSRFVSCARDDRAIWTAMAAGNDRSAVANVVKKSLDEIDQLLAALRPLRTCHAPKNWVARYAGLFDFTGLKG